MFIVPQAALGSRRAKGPSEAPLYCFAQERVAAQTTDPKGHKLRPIKRVMIPPRITISISPPLILSLLLVGLIHVIVLWFIGLNPPEKSKEQRFRVVNVRTLGKKKAKKEQIYLSKSEKPGKEVTEKAYSKQASQQKNTVATSAPTAKNKQSFEKKDLNLQKEGLNQRPQIKSSNYSGKRLLEAFRSKQNLQYLSQDSVRSLSNSDFFVHADVPEGVDLDELNEFEFVFYSFQKRLAEQYFNSFFSQLGDFQRRNPHLQFPMTKQKQLLTARVTFDSQGNIEEIELLEESDVADLQTFYIDVLDRMKAVPNPPKALLDKKGKMRVYYSLRIF